MTISKKTLLPTLLLLPLLSLTADVVVEEQYPINIDNVLALQKKLINHYMNVMGRIDRHLCSSKRCQHIAQPLEHGYSVDASSHLCNQLTSARSSEKHSLEKTIGSVLFHKLHNIQQSKPHKQDVRVQTLATVWAIIMVNILLQQLPKDDNKIALKACKKYLYGSNGLMQE